MQLKRCFLYTWCFCLGFHVKLGGSLTTKSSDFVWTIHSVAECVLTLTAQVFWLALGDLPRTDVALELGRLKFAVKPPRPPPGGRGAGPGLFVEGTDSTNLGEDVSILHEQGSMNQDCQYKAADFPDTPWSLTFVTVFYASRDQRVPSTWQYQDTLRGFPGSMFGEPSSP